MALLIGTDPEFFLWDTVEQRHVSAHEMLPGNKKEPYKVKHGAVQVDGTAVEFNIDPASTYQEFEHNVSSVLVQLRGMIPRRYSFDFSPIITYDPGYFRRLPKQVKELGCDPDFNARTMQLNKIPKSIKSRRTGSGHIHLGWTEKADTTPGGDHFADCVLLVKNLDATLGPVVENLSPVYSDEVDRWKYYGSAGSFRAKPYGVEYRHPSNAWLSSFQSWKEVYTQAEDTFNKSIAGQRPTLYAGYTGLSRKHDVTLKLGL